MSTLQALLVFLGIPVALFGLITALVLVFARRERERPPLGPPVGVSLAAIPCTTQPDGTGREVHEPDPGGDTDRRCWTLACAECGTPYREKGTDVHFTGVGHAVSVARHQGWVLAGHRMRCRGCA